MAAVTAAAESYPPRQRRTLPFASLPSHVLCEELQCCRRLSGGRRRGGGVRHAVANAITCEPLLLHGTGWLLCIVALLALPHLMV